MSDAATFNAIDLSRLPAPSVFETLSYEQIYAQMLARLREFIPDFDDTIQGDPAVKVLQVAAYFRMLDRQAFNDAALARLIAYATGADLDHMVALLGVERLEGESDNDLRSRAILAPEAFSVAGPVGAYIYHARSAHPDVLDASADSPEPGEVLVAVLSRIGDGEASPALLAAVEARLNDQDVRPLTDEVTVQSAEIIPYSVEATLKPYSGPDPSVVLLEAERRAQDYADAQHRLGRDVTTDGFIAAIRAEGAQKVVLISPAADIPISRLQASYCTGIVITLLGAGE